MNIAWSQISAIGRHALTASTSVLATLTALQVLSSGDAATIAASITHVSNGMAEIITGISPLVILASTFYASWSASHKSQIDAVNNTIPGVKVVDEFATAKTVTEPPKA